MNCDILVLQMKHCEIIHFFSRAETRILKRLLNAESFVMVLKRASFVYQKLLTLTDKTVVVFSHAQFIKVLLLLRDYHKCNPIEMMAKFTQLPHIENCEIVKYL